MLWMLSTPAGLAALGLAVLFGLGAATYGLLGLVDLATGSRA